MNANIPLQWLSGVDGGIRVRMFKEKLQMEYARPSHLDTFAKMACVTSERSHLPLVRGWGGYF